MDRIEKQVELKATVERVWQALTDSREFGLWFGCSFAEPFKTGGTLLAQITYPGYEHLTMEIQVIQMERGLFSFRWHPYAIDPAMDYSGEATTLVEFHVEPTKGGTLLRVIESGVDAIPEGRRSAAFRMNVRGWEQQMESIDRYLAAKAEP